jgi:alkanesulfonate monooxygenase SsuD/methylene tetrahydromethanopterin reductase-like flavin-dependent oxidoreductase (luciferase family)
MSRYIRPYGAQQASDHPLFSDRKLRLGTFSTNLDGGTVVSKIEGRADGTWPNTLEIAKIADEMDFEALVPVGRWRTVEGDIPHYSSMEVYTWAAGIGALTRNAGIFATSHTSTVHPLMAAKQGTTIDHITNGRFALNVVCGWYRAEMEMFGLPLMPHEERYASAAEWLQIVKRLWVEDEPFDFEGRYYRVDKAQLRPKPLQQPMPPIMNAGTSPTGQHFAAKYCDVAFAPPADFDTVKAQVGSYKEIARNEYGRDLKIWSYACVVQAETEKAARDYYNYFVHDQGDWKAVEQLMEAFEIKSPPIPPEQFQVIKESFIAGGTGYPLIGTKDQVVDGLAKLVDLGLDGVLLSWPRYLEGIKTFQTDTLPLLQQAGLR